MDIRVFSAVQEMKKTDTSFTEKENFFTMLSGGIKYSQPEVRKIWFEGIELGIETGLRMSSLDGQRIETKNNMKNERHKEFYNKFLELSKEYNCGIQYHPEVGMCVVDLERQ